LPDGAKRIGWLCGLLRQMPVQQHWSLYLFHPDKIEELKKGL
jgi:hypothetical protein